MADARVAVIGWDVERPPALTVTGILPAGDREIGRPSRLLMTRHEERLPKVLLLSSSY